MADKSFGVKELNLLNASGTPTVTSPNNLNLNANTVAISTSCTIGNNLTVTSTTNSANLNVTGIGTLTRGFATDLSVSGISTISLPSNANPHSLWDVVNNGASAYRFTGPGQDGAENNPDIYLVRGQRYVFKMNASGHPFQIRVANGGAAYSDGVTNNGAQTGNVVFNVQHDAPAQLYYQCTSHGGMVGNIYIVGGPQVISGVVTATTFVGNLTGTASANAVLTGSTNDQLVTVTGANAITGESALTYTNNILKNEVSDASGLTAHILVNNSESSSGLSLLGAGSSFSSGGWAPVTDAGHIRTSAGSANGLVLQASAGDMRFYVDGSPTERLRITSGGISKFQNFGGGQIHLGGDSAHTAKVTITDNNGTGNGNFILAGPSSEHLRITSGGSVRIGDNSSFTADTSADELVIGASNSGVNRGITILNHTGQDGRICFAQSGATAAGMIKYSHGSNVLQFFVESEEMVRLNNTSVQGTPAMQLRKPNAASNVQSHMIHLIVGGHDRGALIAGSSFGSSAILGSISDYRVKTNIRNYTSGWDNIKALPVKIFDINKEGEEATDIKGWIAHEVQSVIPEAVIGTKDAKKADGSDDLQSLGYNVFMPDVVGALQTAMAKIETLEAKVAALEGS